MTEQRWKANVLTGDLSDEHAPLDTRDLTWTVTPPHDALALSVEAVRGMIHLAARRQGRTVEHINWAQASSNGGDTWVLVAHR